MRRIITFLFGMIVGGILLYGALNYHILRAKDGFHLIPKTSARLGSTYVDIRNFTVTDMANHADIVEVIILSDKKELMRDATSGAIENGINRFLDRNSGQ
ncbi:MAG: hypothetical protein MKZ95_12390 [Pirellulales bacterium]|nr:hypothetical protein [Pirellulales bacterium]